MSGVRASVSEALWAVCVGDSMSMPVHWFYNSRDIRREFNDWICGFRGARDSHPSSIMSLSSTVGSGRTFGSRCSELEAPVIGKEILHDKLEYWKNSRGSVHYHRGLPAGANTLNVLCALRAAHTLSSETSLNVCEPRAQAAVLSDYIGFMTRPGSHNDTYAESFHRSFFRDWRESRPTAPEEVLEWAAKRSTRMLAASSHDDQLNAIGCLPLAIPFILMSASANEEQAVRAAVQIVKLTHPHSALEPLVSLYAQTLHAVLNGACLRQASEAALRSPELQAWGTSKVFIERAQRFPASSEEQLKVHQSAVETLGLACYTHGALCSLFHLAYCFHDDLRAGILTNTNCGGENCNRGAALGALLGARSVYLGSAVPQQWKDTLQEKESIREILHKLSTHRLC